MKMMTRIKARVKKYILTRNAKMAFKGAKIGINVRAEIKQIAKNPQYFTIGDDCYFGPDCRIEAWDSYLDDTFNPMIVFGNDVRINSTCHIGCNSS